VSDLIGVENLIPNPSSDGSGLHQTTTGGFLNVHPHLAVHPHWSSWQRRVNLLLHLNEDWRPEILAYGDRYFQRRRGGP